MLVDLNFSKSILKSGRREKKTYGLDFSGTVFDRYFCTFWGTEIVYPDVLLDAVSAVVLVSVFDIKDTAEQGLFLTESIFLRSFFGS